MKKTKFGSYCINGIAEGCKHCVKGEKLVLFITGICSRDCKYCSLSNLRKNIDKIWANERECQKIEEVINEAEDSKADSAGITGGDPILKLERTIEYASDLKKKFGKEFQIHIYLPTKTVDNEKLKKLAKVIDEVRFHPSFLCEEQEKSEDIKKIKLAKNFFKKENIGIEMPMIPDQKEEILDFILSIQDEISFVNLNEFEIGESNFEYITSKYTLKKGGYVVSGSKEAGIWVLKELEKNNSRLKVHLCTADTKNNYQYRNRLKLHKILPFGKRTEDGTVIYLAVSSDVKELNERYPNESCIDKSQNRLIISEKLARKLLKDYKIEKVEEFPTYDRIEIEKEYIN